MEEIPPAPGRKPVPTNPKPSQGLKLNQNPAGIFAIERSNQPKTLSGIETGLWLEL